MSLGLLFPGQGTQHPGMLPWLLNSEQPSIALQKMQELLGMDWREHLRDSAWATTNANAQVLLTGVCLAAWERLKPLLPKPKAVAGYSVGELPAVCVAGTLDTVSTIELAGYRALIMDACEQGRQTGLMAVSGLSEKSIEQLCEQHGLYPAIQLGLGHVILGGPLEKLSSAQEHTVALGGTCKTLAVALASHTPLLSEGVAPLATVLAGMAFSTPTVTPIFNVNGQPAFNTPSIREALARQIAQTVRWDACMDAMQEQGVTCVLEVGPGSTLSHLWQARFPHIPARSVDEFRQAQSAANWVRSNLRP